ncbi:MAG TPA: phosphatase PAP2 family protein, partial [Aquihabitans sp.]|nr:phosphatase PAP2 family protein [Aquihabitans sp.]
MPLELGRAVRARLDPAERYGLRLTLFAVALVVVAVPFAGLTFAVLDDGGPIGRFDSGAAGDLNRWAHRRPAVVDGFEVVTALGSTAALLVVVGLAVGFLWRPGRHRVAAFLVVTAVGGMVVDGLVKAAVDRPRPVLDHPLATASGQSFPSGHAMSSTVTYGALVIALWPHLPRRARVPAAVGAVLVVLAIGVSRLVLGVHFVTDVAGGHLLGVAWLAGATAAFAAWRHD